MESNGIFRKNKMDYDKNLSDYRLCKHMYYRSYTKCIHISFNSQYPHKVNTIICISLRRKLAQEVN